MNPNNKFIKKRKSDKNDNAHLQEVKDKVLTRSGELPVKIFEDRQSILTELFENKHLQTIYHIFMAFFIGISINSVVHDYLYNGEVRLGYNLVSKGFRNIHLMTVAWFPIFFLSLVPYYGIKYWAIVRSTFKRNSLQLYLWDRVSLTFYIAHLFAMLYSGTALLMKWDLGFTSSLALIIETLRMIMKVYSFGRVCVSRVLDKPEKYTQNHPKMSHYLYFSFAPTLLYRDNYPRLPGRIRWGYIAIYACEFIVAIIFLSIMFDRVFIPPLQNYGLKHIPVQDILMTVMNNAPYGLLIMLTVNYIVLHIWLNAFAEILRFSDRLFYKDWWTSTTYERYYRTWNTVVHDWLYAYVYKDFFEIVLPKKKILAKIAVFFVSSLFHDYAMSVSLGYFIPVFFLYFFILGELFAYLKFPNNLMGNVFLFYTMGLGASMMVTVYSLEFYARLNCVKGTLTTVDYFVPKLFECYK